MWNRNARKAHDNRPGHRRPSRRLRPVNLDGIERLDSRVLPAVTASFAAAQGILTVIGDAQDNSIVISRNAAGAILVNGGAVTVKGTKPTVANTRVISGRLAK